MTRPTKTIVDCSTGLQTTVELTDEEIAILKTSDEKLVQMRAKSEAELQAQQELKLSALAKLTALGLTEEEAEALSR